MKRQIRNGVFETNSSSMHSLVVKKSGEYYTSAEISDEFYLWEDKETGNKCIWEIWDHKLEFGRSPFRALATFKDKWLYACASLVQEYNDEIYKELERIAIKYVPALEKIELPTTNSCIYNKDSESNKDDLYVEKYGMTEEKFFEYLIEKEKLWNIDCIEYYQDSKENFRFNKPYTGYVDEDVLSGFLKKENISLEEYLTNKKYVVIQDGDEYGYWNDMKKSGLVNMDAIDHEYK